MTADIAIIISIVSLGFGIYSGVTNMKRNNKNDTKIDTAQLTTVIVKLENIGNDISEIKNDLRDVKADIKDHGSRLVKLEQQIKVLNKVIFDGKENLHHEN